MVHVRGCMCLERDRERIKQRARRRKGKRERERDRKSKIERQDEGVGERMCVSKRARERESARKRDQERKRTRMRESERARERARERWSKRDRKREYLDNASSTLGGAQLAQALYSASHSECHCPRHSQRPKSNSNPPIHLDGERHSATNLPQNAQQMQQQNCAGQIHQLHVCPFQFRYHSWVRSLSS